MDARYKQRKVLARDQYARPLMTMARFVPWGIPVAEGIPTLALARYLRVARSSLILVVRRLGIEPYWSSPDDNTRSRKSRSARGQRLLLSEEDVAKVIVHVRVRDGERALRSKASPVAPPPESTGESDPSP